MKQTTATFLNRTSLQQSDSILMGKRMTLPFSGRLLSRAAVGALSAMALVAISGVITPSAQAQAFWSTNAADGNITNANPPANWWTSATGPTAYTLINNSTWQFNKSTVTTLTNNLAQLWTNAGITFNAGASAYTIGGNTLTLGGNIVNSSTSLQTFNNAFGLSKAVSITSGTNGGNLLFNGNLTTLGGTLKQTFNGTGTTTLAGSNTMYNVEVTGGALKVAGNTYVGPVGGNTNAALNVIGGGATLEVQTGGTLTFTNGGIGGGALVIGSGNGGGRITNAGTLQINTGNQGIWIGQGGTGRFVIDNTGIINIQGGLSFATTGVAGQTNVFNNHAGGVVNRFGVNGSIVIGSTGPAINLLSNSGTFNLLQNNVVLGNTRTANGANQLALGGGTFTTAATSTVHVGSKTLGATNTINILGGNNFFGNLTVGIADDGWGNSTNAANNGTQITNSSYLTNVNGNTWAVYQTMTYTNTNSSRTLQSSNQVTVINTNTVNLSDGTLVVRGTIGVGTGLRVGTGAGNITGTNSGGYNSFNWSGGNLSFGTLNATSPFWNGPSSSIASDTLYNTNAGTLLVGNITNGFAGRTAITGNYTQSGSATTTFKILGISAQGVWDGGTNNFSTLAVSSNAVINGGKIVLDFGAFVPTAGNAFGLLTTRANGLSVTGLSSLLGGNNVYTSALASNVAFASDGLTYVGLSTNNNTLTATAALNQWRGGDGNWTATNFSSGVAPNSTNLGGYFANTGGTVTLTNNVTVNSLTLSNATGYALAGGSSTLTLSKGNGSGVTLTSSAGSNSIAPSIVLGGNLTVTGNRALSLNGNISDGGAAYALLQSNSSQVNLNGSNSYSGGTFIGSGTLGFGSGSSLGSGSVTNNATLAYTGGSTAALTNTVTGNGSLLVNGAGTLSLQGSQAFTGVTVRGGGLNVSGSQLTANAITVNGGNLTVSSSVGAITLTGGSATVSGTAGNVTASGGTLSGTGALGATTINAGSTVNVSGVNATSAGTLSVSSLLINGGSYTWNFSGSASDLIASSGEVIFNNNSSSKFAITVNNIGNDWNSAVSTNYTILTGSSYAGFDTSAISVTSGNAGLAGSWALSNSVANGLALVYTAFNTAIEVTSPAGVTTLQTSNPNTVFADSGDSPARLVMNGAGEYVLNMNNTYSGSTTIGSGTLSAANNSSLGSSPTLYLGTSSNGGSNAALNISSSGVTVSANVDVLGTGANVIGNSSGGQATYSGTVNLLTNATVTNSAGGSTLLSGVISGASTLTVSPGSGTVTLAASNTYSGGTTLNGGTLAVGNDSALGSGTLAVTANATLQAASSVRVTNNQSVASSATETLDANGNAFTNAGIISGNGSLAVTSSQGTGTVTLSGANTYTGTTTVNGGTLSLGSINALPTTTGLTVGNTGTVNLSGINASVAGLTSGGSGALITNTGAASTFTLNTTSDDNFGGQITGAVRLTKSGAGTQTLSGSNSYTGGTTINGGNLTVVNNNALGATTNSLNVSGGTLSNNASITQGAVTLGNAAISGTGTLTATSISATNTAAATVNNSLIVSQFTNSSTGTTTLAGSNTFRDLRVSSGTIDIAGNSTSTNGISVLSGGTLAVQAGGTLTFTNGTAGAMIVGASGGAGSRLTNAGTMNINTDLQGLWVGNGGSNNNVVDNSGIMNIGGVLTFGTGNGNATATNVFNNYAGGVVNKSSFGTVGIGGGVSSLNLLRNSGTFNMTNGGGVSIGSSANGTGVNQFAVESGGTFNGSANFTIGSSTALSGTNILSVNAGGLLNSSSYLFLGDNGSQNNLFNINGTSTFLGETQVGRGSSNNANTINIQGGNATFSVVTLGTTQASRGTNSTNTINLGSGTMSVTQFLVGGNSAARGSTNLINFNGGTLRAASGANANFLGSGIASVTLNNGGGTIDSSTNAITVGASIGGTGALTKSGAGTLTLSGANSYTGGSVINAGVLTIGNIDALGASTNALTVNGGVLNLNGNSLSLGSLAGSGGSVSNSVAGTQTINAGGNDSSTTYSGVISSGTGVIALSKTGSGTLTLSGDNSYTGGTTITAGQITVGNNSALGATTNTLTLDGGTLRNDYSIIQGAVTLGGGTISGTGTLTGTSFIVTPGAIVGVSNSLAGSGGLTLRNFADTLTLSGSNSYTGGTTISAGFLPGLLIVDNTYALGATTNALNVAGGTLRNNYSITQGAVTFGNALISGSGTLTGTSFTVTDGATASVANTLAGSGSLTLNNGSSATLSASNSYTGGTRINGGALTIDNNNALGATTNTLNVASGDLNNNYSITQGAVTLGNGNISGTGTLTATSISATNTAAATVNNSLILGGFTNASTGRTTLAGSNTFRDLRVSSGTIDITGNSTATNAISVISGGTLAVQEGGNLTYITTNTASAFSIGSGSGVGARFTNAGTANINLLQGIWLGQGGSGLNRVDNTGIINLNGVLALAVTGNSSATNVFNNHAGGVVNKTLQDLSIGIQNAALNLLSNSGTFNMSGGWSVNIGNGTNATGVNQLAVGSGGTFTNNGVMILGRSAATSGTNILSVDSGAILINSGAFTIGNAGSQVNSFTNQGSSTFTTVTVGSGSSNNANTIDILDGNVAATTVTLGSTGTGTNNTNTINLGSGTLSATQFIAGGSSATRGSTNSINFNGGTLRAASGANTNFMSNGIAKVTLNEGGGTIDSSTNAITVSATIGGSGALTKSGTGTLTLSGANTYTGGSVINGGGLTIGNANALGASTNALTVNNGILNLNGNSVSLGSLAGTGGTVSNSVAGTRTITAGGNNASSTYSGVISSGTGAIALVKNGTGTQTLSGANSYTGGTTINSGAISISTNRALGTGGVAMSGGTSFQYTGAAATIDNSFSVTSGIGRIQNTGGSLLTLAGTITNQGSVLQLLGGSYNVTGAITGNNGTTEITGGARVDLGGSGSITGNTNVVVSAGSTLLLGGGGRTDTVNPNATVQLAGTISMGGLGATTRTASQNFSTLTLTGDSVIDFAALSGNSSITFSSITQGGYLLSIWNYQSGVTRLFDSAGSTGMDLSKISFYGDNGNSLLGGASFSGTEIVPVPEPGVVAAACLLLGWLLVANRGMISNTIATRIRRRAS